LFSTVGSPFVNLFGSPGEPVFPDGFAIPSKENFNRRAGLVEDALFNLHRNQSAL
jgi:hypothetical protein